VKAILLERHGGPEVLVDRELADPRTGPGEILIDVRAAGVNFADLLQRLGLYGSAPPPPYVPGFEVSGTVAEVGEDVDDLEPGQPVVALTRFGGYAARVSTPAEAAMRVPDGISVEDAAALPVNYLTAWFCLHEMAGLSRGERVLVQHGAGGVGVAAVQLARRAGAEILATTSTDDKVEFLRDAGVDHPINYRTTDFADEVRRVAGDRGLDVVLDSGGGRDLARAYDLLAPLGRVVSYGLSTAVGGSRRNPLRALWAWLRTPRFHPVDLIGRNAGVFGFHLALLEDRRDRIPGVFREILAGVADGSLAPRIARTFPLEADGAAAAHRYLHERRNIGKVLLVRSAA